MKRYKIFDKKQGCYTGSYSRAYHMEFEFDSPESALNANCHDMFHNTDKYEIHEVEISEKLVKKVEPKKEHLEKTKENAERDERRKKFMEKNPEASFIDFAFSELLKKKMGDIRGFYE